ncbi:YlbE-like family protein [Natribacillus halophilus]|uniref:YlbE-like protein n=1 Tax=Natribacillus halophilus TaxID=549003 RepID=A0A1G8MD01_9BACI|nr:YlbE-like family protein [Natribacillus halophilus]SDI65816.1 YlbE-like protein [Natribacillus halophilus]
MRSDLMQYISAKPDVKHYLRSEPSWYQILARHPERLEEMEKEARLFNGQTWPQRVARMNQGLGLTIQLLNLLKR